MVFVENLKKHTNLSGHMNPILEKKIGVTNELGRWLVGKPMFDFLFALIEHFSLSIKVPSYEAKCVQLGYFHKGVESVDLFALNFYLDRVVPYQPSFYVSWF